MFSSRVTKAIKTPTKPQYTVTIRQLSGRAKERCQQATLAKAADMMHPVGGAAVFDQIRQMGGEDKVREQVEDHDPTAAYDRDQVLLDGVVSWTADEPVTADTLADLDDPTSDLLVREILRLSKVALNDADVKAQDRDRKNA